MPSKTRGFILRQAQDVAFRRDRGFTLMELLIVIAIMLILANVGFSNFIFSLKKSHDAQRKSDLATIAKGLEAFASDFGDYPDDDDAGKIKACDYGDTGNLSACEPGSPLAAGFAGAVVTYLARIPEDPVNGQTYYYEKQSNGFNLYAGLENTSDPYYSVTAFSCGDVLCNYTLTQAGAK